MKIYVNLSDSQYQFNMDCSGASSCNAVRGIVKADNNQASIYDSNVNCTSNDACYNSFIDFIGVNQVNVICNGHRACKWAKISSLSWDINQKYNNLNIHCHDGQQVCEQLLVNGLGISNVNVTCHSSLNGFQCANIQVYCPINPFKNSNNYSISNMDSNSCYIDLNNRGDYARIYTIYGIPQSHIINTNSNGLTELLCEFDWFNERTYFYGISNPGSFCIDSESIENNILNKIINNEIVLKLSDPNSNEISCLNDNNNCVIYAMQQYNEIKNIICPNGDYTCSIVR